MSVTGQRARSGLEKSPSGAEDPLCSALLAGHNQTATTELVYRHQIVPALTRGAEVMDQIFG